MPRYVISPAAERDMESILAWSEDQPRQQRHGLKWLLYQPAAHSAWNLLMVDHREREGVVADDRVGIARWVQIRGTRNAGLLIEYRRRLQEGIQRCLAAIEVGEARGEFGRVLR